MTTPTILTNSWYQQHPGSWLLDLERLELANILARSYGSHLMQIGGTHDLLHCADSPIMHRFQLITEVLPPYPQCSHISANLRELPILPGSLNVVLLIHAIEFAKYPVRLLEEVYQGLAPGGRIIILGFNPWSYWGLLKTFKGKKESPWNGKFWSRAHIKQWLRGYDYSIDVNKTLCFRSPHGRSRSRRLTLFTEAFGQLCFPTLGGIYLIAATKKVYQPLRERKLWWKRHPVGRRIIEPTTRI